MAKKVYKFVNHDEIPAITAEYVLSVADADSIWSIPIDEINEFLNDLEEYDGLS